MPKKHSNKIQIPLQTYDTISQACISCHAGIGVMYDDKGYYHQGEAEGENQEWDCPNSATYKQLFKNCTKEVHIQGANEVIGALFLTRKKTFEADIENLMKTKDKKSRQQELVDYCEGVFRNGLVHGYHSTGFQS